MAKRKHIQQFGERGAMMVELGIILPVLLLLFLGTFEFGLYLKNSERGASLSRQIANYAFRSCLIPPPSQVDMVDCIDETTASFEPFVDEVAGDASVVVTAYGYNPGLNTVDRLHRTYLGDPETSEYPDGSTSSDNFRDLYVSAMMPTNPRIVIVEVFDDYKRSQSYFAGFFEDQTLYHASIF